LAAVAVRSPGLKRFVKRWARRSFATVERIVSIRGGSGPSHGMRILTYHRVVDDPADPFAVSPTAFAAQLELVAQLGIVRTVRAALESLHLDEPGSPMLVLTFDDGTQDFLANAWPVLDRLALTAIVYVNPSRVGTPGFLNWPDLRELSLRGIQIESHGMEHRSLGCLERAEIRRQLRQSKAMLEDQLGREVSSFAYPFGTLRDFNADTREEIRLAGYQTACTSLNGLNDAGTDPLELHRTKIEQGDGPIFSWILAGCMDRWEWIDRHLSRFQNQYVAEG
jgi:peptidoglycan/xylan/chitin deacetylase (PgdA/CDA1 family)